MEGFLGEVKMFVGTYAPEGWAFCDGSLLPIATNTALFALLGIQFGGDGRVNFALPDLRGRVAIGAGHGIALTPRVPGERSGIEDVTLLSSEMPAHSHYVRCDEKTGARSVVASPENNVPANITSGEGYGSDLSGGTHMNQDMLSSVGAQMPHINMQPWTAMNYIICVNGVFPPRN